MGPKKAKSITKVRENVGFDLAKRNSEILFKFKSLKYITYVVVWLRLLHSIFKASLLRHTLKTFTKLLIKLNCIYASYYVSKIFRNFFHHLRKRSLTFVTV